MTEQRHCRGTNKAGEPCASTAVGDDGFCDFHTPDPVRAAAHKERFHRAGGLTAQSREPVPDRPTSPAEMRDFLGWAIRAAARRQIKEGVLRQIRETAELWFQADAVAMKLAAKEARDG